MSRAETCPTRTPVANAPNPVVFPTPGFETYKTGKPPGPEHTAGSLTSAKTKGPLAENCRQTAVFSLQKLRQTPHKMAAAPSPYNPPQALAPPTPGERACVTELARSRPTPKGRVPHAVRAGPALNHAVVRAKQSPPRDLIWLRLRSRLFSFWEHLGQTGRKRPKLVAPVCSYGRSSSECSTSQQSQQWLRFLLFCPSGPHHGTWLPAFCLL